jgi:UDP-glucuronate 4-epimerase
MKIVVTGAAGFIGSALCQKLAISGQKILALDNFSSYYDVGLKHFRVKEFLEPHDIDIHNLDLQDKIEIDKLIKEFEPEVVINLAAQAGVRLGVSETFKYVGSNLVGFSNVLISTIENKVPLFLYASSSSIYGDNSQIPYSENERNLHPTSFYGATKLANELLTPTLVQGSSTSARGLRFFTVYGPWGRPDMAYFRMIANVISKSEFNFFGDGSIERDFTYINDSVSSIIGLMNELKSHGQGYADVVNVGGGHPVSMNHLLETINLQTNSKVEFNQLAAHSNDVMKTMADSALLKALIGSDPQIKIEEGIANTIKWAQKPEISANLDKWVKSVN